MPLLNPKLMETKSILITALAIGFPVSLLADVLVSGSVYFDSTQTYEEVKRLAAQGDNQGISKLIADRHVSQPVPNDVEVSINSSGQAPYGLVEFRFQGKPTPYWSLAKCVKASSPSLSVTEPEPVPAPNPSQASRALPAATPSPATVSGRSHRVVHHGQRRVHRYWHLVNGHWRWSPVPLRSSDGAPRALPVNSQRVGGDVEGPSPGP